MNQTQDLIDRLRLIRTPGTGPISYRQLLLRFGNAEAALAAILDLCRRGGGKAPAIFSRGAAQRELAAVEKAGARYLVLGQGLYPRALALLENAPPLRGGSGPAGALEGGDCRRSQGPVDAVVRQSGAEPGAVQLVLLELDLAGRLVRHAGNKVSLSSA